MKEFHVVCRDAWRVIRAISRPHDLVTAGERCREVQRLGVRAEVALTSRALRALRAELERSQATAPPIACERPDDVSWDDTIEMTEDGWRLAGQLRDVERHKEDPAA